jgi:TRAP-type C4-dicarboxylate transport system substrate-binding protein
MKLFGSNFAAHAARRWLPAALLGWAALAEAAPKLTLGTLAPEGTSYHRSLLEMRERWRKAPGGGADFIIHAGGRLGGDAKMVSQMRLKALDAGLLTSAGLADIEPAVTGLQNIPMLYRTFDEADYIGSKLQPMLEERMERKGFVVLFWSDAGWVRFFSKKLVVAPDDLRRLQLFAWAGDAELLSIWKAAGFQPVPLETAQIVPMLDTGLIEAVPMPPFAALAGQVYTRAPYMLELNWSMLVGALVVRKAVWDKFPPETQKALREAALETGRANKQQGRAEGQKSVEAMQAKGLKVHRTTPAEEAEWRKLTESFYPRIRGKLVPADIFDQVRGWLKEYRASRDTGDAPTNRP